MNHRFEFRPIDCPTCEVDDTRVIGRRGGSAHRDGTGDECTIVECRRCGLIYANPFPMPRDLDALYSGTEDFFALHAEPQEKTTEREALIARFEPLVSGRRILDVGAGLGETTAAALRRGWDAYGIESSVRFADEAKRRCPGRIFHGEIQNAPADLVKDPFDAVILAAVLEHLHEPDIVLAAIARVLRPGGILFVDVPNDAGLYTVIGNLWQRLLRRDWVVHLSPTFPPYHVFAFTRKSLTAMLRKHGLEPEIWRFYAGTSALPFRRSVRGALEWAASEAIHRVAGFGELGTYLETFARRR